MGAIAITRLDFDRLERLVDRLRDEDGLPSIANALEEELDRAEVLEPHAVPPDVVTMNSEATVRDLGTGEVEMLRVVFPAAASPRKGAISITAPLGLALLGTRAGDEVTWDMPGGPRHLRVERVTYQPEAAGRYDL